MGPAERDGSTTGVPGVGDAALGAVPDGRGGWAVRLWAPKSSAPILVLTASGEERPLEPDPSRPGHWTATIAGWPAGTRYGFRLAPGGPVRADPASRWQPDGVLAPSALWEDRHAWMDQAWSGLCPGAPDFSVYELHVGTFTAEGTFDAAIADLPRLARLGVSALELLPVSQCPGRWNWGYDGVFPYAVQDSLGGAPGLCRLVDAAHQAGLGVIMDVVYNHIGPEGVFWEEFAPYFSSRHRTPWGPALNFDGKGSDGVRAFFLGHALEWQRRFHLDGFRFDAVHAVVDQTAWPFWEQVTTAVHAAGAAAGRPAWLVAESDWNAPRAVRPPEGGGLGFDAFWSDDVHHAVHAALTGDRAGYYQDFGALADVGTALERGLVQTGRWSGYRGRTYGRPYDAMGRVDAAAVVAYLQNHDQVGNRPVGDRLAAQVGVEAAKAAAGLVVTSPFVPMLFMGEEYGELAPFLYFVDHAGAALMDAVRCGRAEEARDFGWREATRDPTAAAALENSRLTRREQPGVAAYYAALLAWRRHPALAARQLSGVRAYAGSAAVAVERSGGGQRAVLLWVPHPSPEPIAVPLPRGTWRLCLESSDPRYGGPGRVLPPEAAGGARLAVPGPSFSIWEPEDQPAPGSQ